MLFGTRLTRRDVMKAAWRIRREDRLTMAHALRRAWLWARRKGLAAAAPVADRYAAARAVGVYSPADRSPEALTYFAERARRFPGRGSGSFSTGR